MLGVVKIRERIQEMGYVTYALMLRSDWFCFARAMRQPFEYPNQESLAKNAIDDYLDLPPLAAESNL